MSRLLVRRPFGAQVHHRVIRPVSFFSVRCGQSLSPHALRRRLHRGLRQLGGIRIGRRIDLGVHLGARLESGPVAEDSISDIVALQHSKDIDVPVALTPFP